MAISNGEWCSENECQDHVVSLYVIQEIKSLLKQKII